MPTLVHITATGVGRKYPVGTTCIIGRHPECHIQVVDAQMSKQHAEITVQDGDASIRDLDSLNGVFVNGARVDGTRRLCTNDIISIGSLAFLYDPSLDVLPVDDGSRAVILVEGEQTGDLSLTPVQAPQNETIGAALAGSLVRVLTGEKAAEEAAPELMQRLGRFVPFDAAALLVGRQDAEALYVASRRRTVSVPRSLLKMALDEHKAILIPDAVGDTYFAKGKSVVAQELRSVLLCPLAVGQITVGAVFLTKDEPGSYDGESVQRLVEAAPLLAVAVAQTRRLTRLARRVQSGPARHRTMVGDAEGMANVRRAIDKAAAVDTPVLILGETGTGKELVARQLHELGPRVDGPFVPVNCGAIPDHLVESELFGYEKGAFSGAEQQKPGHMEIASGGTLFLDEVAELPQPVQVKLLRALQERTFYRLGGIKPVHTDFRLLAATHRNLDRAVEKGLFRQDLYYRLNVLRIEVPPLRARREDIAPLIEHFIAELGGELGRRVTGVAPAAMQVLESYPWPGNVRELRNVIERAIVLMDDEEAQIGRSDLPPEILGDISSATPATTMPERVAALEREMIVDALKNARGKKVIASRTLGISRPTLDRKIRAYAIDIFAEDA